MRKVPELRFDGFDGEWDSNYLKKLASIYDGTHQTPNYTKSGVKFLSVENIKDLKATKYISEKDFEKDFKVFPEFNDILMTRIGSVGITNIIKSNEKFAYYVTLALIKPKELIFPEFLNYSINSLQVQKEIWKRTLHVAFPNKINMNEIGEIPLNYPVWDEQEKIGDLFRKIDDLIETQETKISKMEDFKKSMLQKMFPKKDELVPEFRFDGFEGEWIVVSVKDLGKIVTGNTPKTNIPEYWSENHNHVWVTPTDINGPIINNSERYLTDLGVEVSRLIPENSVLITSIASIGKNSVNTIPVSINQQINAIIPSESSPYFIMMAFERYIQIFKSLAGNTATQIVNKTNFKNFSFPVPNLEEQVKIGQFFKNLDTQIENEEKLLDSYKMMKKSFLQKMFV